MKSAKVFWTSVLLLAVLGLGACAQLAAQKKAPPTTTQEEEKERRHQSND
jgi:hypothetical protein